MQYLWIGLDIVAIGITFAIFQWIEFKIPKSDSIGMQIARMGLWFLCAIFIAGEDYLLIRVILQ